MLAAKFKISLSGTAYCLCNRVGKSECVLLPQLLSAQTPNWALEQNTELDQLSPVTAVTFSCEEAAEAAQQCLTQTLLWQWLHHVPAPLQSSLALRHDVPLTLSRTGWQYRPSINTSPTFLLCSQKVLSPFNFLIFLTVPYNLCGKGWRGRNRQWNTMQEDAKSVKTPTLSTHNQCQL